MKKQPFLKKLFSQNSKECASLESNQSRQYVAEPLEARILYSAAPAPVDAPEAPAHEVVENDTAGDDFQPIDGFNSEAGLASGSSISPAATNDQLVTLTSLDNLSPAEIQQLAETTVEYWSSDLDLEPVRLEALQNLEIALTDFDGLTQELSTNGVVVSIVENGDGTYVDDSLLSGDFDFADITSTGLAEAEQTGLDVITDLIVEAAQPVALNHMIEELIADREIEIPTDQIPLTFDTLNDLVEAAEQRWAASGLSAEQLAALDQIEYQIVDLDAGYLGSAEGYQVTLDIDAAGLDWFIDRSPYDDSEFSDQRSLTALRSTGGDATYM